MRCSCGFSLFLLFSSPILSGRRLDVYHTFDTRYGLSANLECMSEMCCTRLAGNTGRKNRQKSAICHHHTTLSAYIFATKACIDNREKTCPHNMVNFSALPAEICWRFGHSSKLQRVLRVGFITAATSLNGGHPNFARCLAVSWTGTLYIHFQRFLPSDGILPGAKFTVSPSFAFYYIGSVTARHTSSGRQPIFAALSRGRHLYSAWRPSRWASAHILV